MKSSWKFGNIWDITVLCYLWNSLYICHFSVPPEFKWGNLNDSSSQCNQMCLHCLPFHNSLTSWNRYCCAWLLSHCKRQKIFCKFQVHFILSRVEYATKNNVKKFGINKLLDSGIYKAAFPLHDVSPFLSQWCI